MPIPAVARKFDDSAFSGKSYIGGKQEDSKRRDGLPDAEPLTEANKKKAGKMISTFG